MQCVRRSPLYLGDATVPTLQLLTSDMFLHLRSPDIDPPLDPIPDEVMKCRPNRRQATFSKSAERHSISQKQSIVALNTPTFAVVTSKEALSTSKPRAAATGSSLAAPNSVIL